MLYQQGVPTKVFLALCLSPESKRQAETPKSPSLIPPRESTRIFPAYHQNKGKQYNNYLNLLKQLNREKDILLICLCGSQKRSEKQSRCMGPKLVAIVYLPSHLDVYAHDGEDTLNLSGLHEALWQ